jgi:hypothetical protein
VTVKKFDIARWLGAADAGRYLGYSRDWVERRALEWQDKPASDRIRYKKARSDGRRRYFVPDLEAQLCE